VKTILAIDKLERASKMLKSMAHPIRMSIIERIKMRGPQTVTELQEALKIEQAVVSQHLSVMRNNNILTVERDGKNCIYALKFEHIKDILSCIERCTDC
jgi:DNA-binding transcriptional ArsR family regulator